MPILRSDWLEHFAVADFKALKIFAEKSYTTKQMIHQILLFAYTGETFNKLDEVSNSNSFIHPNSYI